jgi:murein DD-endopeptidase / murein LD-carboxypeptidase
MSGADVAAAARACLGAPFRRQGRDPASGLDCVGLAGIAFAVRDLPADYALRGGDPARAAALIDRAGLVRIDPPGAAAGDLLLCAAGPEQLHLAVLTAAGFVHADARLRRVVEVPGPPGWPVLGAWRAGEG